LVVFSSALFVSASSNVTSVAKATNNIDKVGMFFSGGVFGDYFPRPSYQDTKVIQAYLEKLP